MNCPGNPHAQFEIQDANAFLRKRNRHEPRGTLTIMNAPTCTATGGSPALVTTPSLFALNAIGPGGPLSELPAGDARRILDLADLVGEQPGAELVAQYHRGDYFYLLLKGQVEFSISLESTGQSLEVGTASQVWTPIGWSALRAPQRYATTVRATTYSEFLRFPVARLQAFFESEPKVGWLFFQSLTKMAESLLEEARERLLARLNPEGEMDSERPSSERGSLSFSPVTTEHTTINPRITAEEAMVTNAAPHVRHVLRVSPFFEVFPEAMLAEISKHAHIEYFCRGGLLKRSRSGGADLLVLADGKAHPEYTGTCGRTLALRGVHEPGQILSWSSEDVSMRELRLRATKDGSLIRFSRASLKRLFTERPDWGYLFQQRILWLLSLRLRSTRVHLVSETFDQEFLAADNLLEQVRTELSVSSPLHKLPHLMRSTVTLTNAMSVVDAARQSRDPLENHTAQICHELLEPLRRESRFFSGLQAAYEEVVNSPAASDPARLRRKNAESFIRIFSQIPTRIEGLSNLPASSGAIFVFNHLKNHDYNTLPNGFQLTLDSHFISSMILHKTYDDPGVRVVRESRAGEYGHHAYYSRLGHISVYTRDSDQTQKSGGQRFREFVEAASAQLSLGKNLVIAPEGTSMSTAESPGLFKAGAFRLAAAIDHEPLIVPIAVANFDARLARSTLVAHIQEPFRMSERVKNPEDPEEMAAFLQSFRSQFKTWVREASALALATH